jgi:outer membrane protein TolC
VQRVRDTVLEVETAYWQLAQARRRAVVLAETVAQTYVTYLNMKERLLNDATAVEVANSEARYRSQYVVFLESLKLIRDAEDRVKNLMNDPELKLSERLEIIPTETPYVAPTVFDQFAEVRTALDRRSEISAQRKRIEQRRVATNVAKNQILPQLDVSFRYEVAGSGNTADNSFDSLTTNRYISATLGVNFAYNFGERAARARHQRSRLEESQAVVELNQLADAIVEEVNGRIRTLVVRYEQIPPQYVSVVAAERNLRAYQARTQRVDPLYLENELQAVEQLGQTRTQLLNVLTDYNVGIIQLERAKGTLLEYNNITVTDVRPPR